MRLRKIVALLLVLVISLCAIPVLAENQPNIGDDANLLTAGEREELRPFFIRRMQEECSIAKENVQGLSRMGGSDNMARLAAIRSNIYAVYSLNQLYSSIYGDEIVSNDLLQSILNAIDGYSADLAAGGMKGTAYLTEISQNITELSDFLESCQ